MAVNSLVTCFSKCYMSLLTGYYNSPHSGLRILRKKPRACKCSMHTSLTYTSNSSTKTKTFSSLDLVYKQPYVSINFDFNRSDTERLSPNVPRSILFDLTPTRKLWSFCSKEYNAVVHGTSN